jgi:uncharacterized protein (TIGR02444 family)
MPGGQKFEGFWDFSVRTYRTMGVPDACLSLQNDYGADVNMLLFCCWTGAVIGRFDAALFARASEFSAQWADHVVVPLRSARTWMKQSGCDTEPMPSDACMQLREEIKNVEFSAEKMQQQVLASLVSIDQSRTAAADRIVKDVVANLMLYWEYAGLEVCEDVRRNFVNIVCAAFPDHEEQSISSILGLRT